MLRLLSLLLALMVASVACAGRSNANGVAADEIVALERGALARWDLGDPQGFIEIMADEETYFDPYTDKRVDGLTLLKSRFAAIAGTIHIAHYEMVAPKVQFVEGVGVLTFNLVDYGAHVNGVDRGTVAWNSTEVFRHIDGRWKIIHSHWSLVQPKLQESRDAARAGV